MQPVSPSLNILDVNVQYADDIQSEVNLETLDISAEIWQNYLELWLNDLKDGLPPAQAYEMTLRLTDNQEIHQLNAQYRFKDQPTDVLAFATLEADFPFIENDEPLYLGDIIISLEMAHQQALGQGHSLKNEVIWLASHGLLHLLGWDHRDEGSLEKMLSRQESLLKLIGILHPLR